jgi:uncharacterized protein (DUF2141 family)
MNRLTPLLVVALTACGPALPVMPEPTITLEPGTATLQATVTKVKTGKGRVFCALHNTPTAFPGASPIIGGALGADPDATSVTCRFEKLPAGTYAISVFQDENANGVLDTNAFGAPTEGYGASRNELPAAAAPTFEDNAVSVGDGAQVTVDITLR